MLTFCIKCPHYLNEAAYIICMWEKHLYDNEWLYKRIDGYKIVQSDKYIYIYVSIQDEISYSSANTALKFLTKQNCDLPNSNIIISPVPKFIYNELSDCTSYAVL